MKIGTGIYIAVLYLAQACIFSSAVLCMKDYSESIYMVFLWLSVAFYAFAVFWGIGLSIASLGLIYKPKRFTYQTVMIGKLVLIPYFLLNFLCCFLLVAGFLNPFLAWSLIIVIPLLIGMTYIAMLPLSLASAALSIGYVRQKKVESQKIILWQILEFFFVLDVFAAIVLKIKCSSFLRTNTYCESSS